ncbi:MAG: hypothetical protein RLY58_1718 [Pseudomonadota bacterium]|jgi:hypothetical protein
MNPIPVRVWTAQHDSARLPKSQRDAERISDELYWQSTDTPNPVYHAFAQDMLTWMEDNHIPLLGDQSELRDDLLNVSVNKNLCLSFEHFPRDNKIIYEQFLLLARQHELVVYDTNYPTTVFLPNKRSIPIGAYTMVSSMAQRQRVSQQQHKATDVPVQFDQVPEWLKIQMDQTFAPFGFSPCIIQIDSDGAIKGKMWKKSPAGLMIIASLVYERYGEIRIWGYSEIYVKELFKVKAILEKKDIYDTSYSTKHEDLKILVEDFEEKSDTLHLFFPKAVQVYQGYIVAFTDPQSFYHYAYTHAFEDATRTRDSRFFLRCNMILNLDDIDGFKAFKLKYENLRDPISAKQVGNDAKILSNVDKQYRLLQEHNIPTLAENASFYAEDFGVEDLILKDYELI